MFDRSVECLIMITSGLAVRAASAARVAHYAPGTTLGPRSLRSYELVWLLSGSARWLVEEPEPTSGAVTHHEHQLVPGMLALARRGTTESYQWDSRRPSSHAFVHLEISALSDVEEAHPWPLVRRFGPSDPMAGLCAYLLFLAASEGPDSRRRSDEIVDLLVDIYVRGPLGSSDQRTVSPIVRVAVKHVRDVWRTGGLRLVSLAEMAAAAEVSSGHLSRQFRAEFSVSPASALERVRLGRAAIALQRSTLRLDDIAREAGFTNPYHFSKRFSLAYGVPPGTYRRTAMLDDPLGPLTSAGLLSLWTATTGDTEGQ